LAEKVALARRLSGDERIPVQNELIENFLVYALDASLERRDRGVEVPVLYQEAVIAVASSVGEFVASDRDTERLVADVSSAVAAHLDKALDEEKAARKSDEALLSDVRMLSAVRTHLRSEKKAEPTPGDLAATLKWPTERVETLLGLLATAEVEHDAEILEYLDDE
jgi:hypothetical protein